MTAASRCGNPSSGSRAPVASDALNLGGRVSDRLEPALVSPDAGAPSRSLQPHLPIPGKHPEFKVRLYAIGRTDSTTSTTSRRSHYTDEMQRSSSARRQWCRAILIAILTTDTFVKTITFFYFFIDRRSYHYVQG